MNRVKLGTAVIVFAVAVSVIAWLVLWPLRAKLLIHDFFETTTITFVNVALFTAAAAALSRFIFVRLTNGSYPRTVLARKWAITGLGVLQLMVLIAAASALSTTQPGQAPGDPHLFGLAQTILITAPLLLGVLAWAIVLHEMDAEQVPASSQRDSEPVCSG